MLHDMIYCLLFEAELSQNSHLWISLILVMQKLKLFNILVSLFQIDRLLTISFPPCVEYLFASVLLFLLRSQLMSSILVNNLSKHHILSLFMLLSVPLPVICFFVL